MVCLLEWAGEKLLALRVSSPKPAEYRTYWPTFALDPNEAYGYTPASVRAPIPTSFEISAMDEILSWMSLIYNSRSRRAVALRSLIHPIRQSHVLTWKNIGAIMGMPPAAAREWYFRGIDTLVAKVSSKLVADTLAALDLRAGMAWAEIRCLMPSGVLIG